MTGKRMSRVHDLINGGDTESLICKYLKAGMMMLKGMYGGERIFHLLD